MDQPCHGMSQGSPASLVLGQVPGRCPDCLSVAQVYGAVAGYRKASHRCRTCGGDGRHTACWELGRLPTLNAGIGLTVCHLEKDAFCPHREVFGWCHEYAVKLQEHKQRHLVPLVYMMYM